MCIASQTPEDPAKYLCKASFLNPKLLAGGEIKTTVACLSILPTLFCIIYTVWCQKAPTWTHLTLGGNPLCISPRLEIDGGNVLSCQLCFCWDGNHIVREGRDLFSRNKKKLFQTFRIGLNSTQWFFFFFLNRCLSPLLDNSTFPLEFVFFVLPM